MSYIATNKKKGQEENNTQQNTSHIVTWTDGEKTKYIDWVELTENQLFVDKNCDYDGLAWYKLIDIFSWDFATPEMADYRNYTKSFIISWYIEDAFLCIISDIRSDYKKPFSYKYSTFIWFWNEENAGHINVGYNKDKKLVYDNSTDKNSPFLDWKFWWHETPYTYYFNLSKVIVANMNDWWYKYIEPIKQLQKWWEILIWWFVNSYPNYRAWKIIKYRIFYKWWSIIPNN